MEEKTLEQIQTEIHDMLIVLLSEQTFVDGVLLAVAKARLIENGILTD